MNLGVVVQARMSSSRLPGKILRLLAGKPVLAYLLEALCQCCRSDQICVATSIDPSDECLESFCETQGVSCFRDSLTDVAGRCVRAAQHHQWDAFIRVCADSPLLDYRLVRRAMELEATTHADIVTNVFPRTYPRGQSVEIVRTDVFRAAYSQMNTPAHYEHVTPYFYENAERYKIVSWRAPKDLSHLNFALDTPHDESRLAAIIGAMRRPPCGYTVEEIADLHDQMANSACKDAA